MAKYSLVGINGNAFSLIGYVKKCMKEEGCTRKEIEEWTEKAFTSGGYNVLLVLAMDMIDKLNDKQEDEFNDDYEEGDENFIEEEDIEYKEVEEEEE